MNFKHLLISRKKNDWLSQKKQEHELKPSFFLNLKYSSIAMALNL